MNKIRILLVLLAFLLTEIEMTAQSVLRGPYLQLNTPTSIIVRWRTDALVQSHLWYGLSPNNLDMTTSINGATTEHEIQLEGLSPSTTYYYRIGDQNGPYPPLSQSQYFRTHPAGADHDPTIRAWVLGNAGTKTDDQREVRDAYYALVQEQHLDMMLLLGDNAYDDGKDHEYQEAWFEDMYEHRLLNSVMWSCFGNHDAGDASSSSESGTYYDIFNFPRQGEAGGIPSGTEAYYSFDYGNLHVISLNSTDVDREPGSPMLQWLEDDLAANNKKWLVAMIHHRPYTGSNNNDSDDDPKPTDVREHMLPLLEAAGCDLVLSGHSHNYQRSYLINGHYGTSDTFDPATMGVDMGNGQSDGDGAYAKLDSNIGTVYIVTGSAGQNSNPDDLHHPVMYYNSGSAGSVQLLISDETMVVEFINEDEEIEDHFTILKNPTPGFKIIHPVNNQFFPVGQQITIATDTTDTFFDIDHVDFFVDDSLVGTDYSFPFYWPWLVPGSGQFDIKAVAHEALSSRSVSASVRVSAGSSERCAAISNPNDDAEEKASGTVKLHSSDLELVEDGSIQQVGLRFQGIDLPSGIAIDSAFIQFTVDETQNTNPSNLQIFGQKSPNPLPFTDDITYDISNRPKTNNVVTWNPPNWEFLNQSGSAQRTPDLKLVVEEIINQPGFNVGQPLAFIITGQGERVAESFEGKPDRAAELCIYYTPTPCSDFDNDGICDEFDPCNNGPEPGHACNDGNPATYNDQITPNCFCLGTPYDCPDLLTNIGAPCDDNNPLTHDDVVTSDCLCQGTPYDCPGLMMDIGTPCDDNNPLTHTDVVTSDCLCQGTPYDCPGLIMDIGTPCDDNNPLTHTDVVTSDCLCQGTPYDCPAWSADIGAPCDDGNPDTNGDTLDENCNCIGSLFDCPVLMADIGDLCDDNNILTENDMVLNDCSCQGTQLPEETMTAQVSHSDDDAEERQNGSVTTSSGDLELVQEATLQTVGIRFAQSGIPASAIITSAYIQFVVDETDTIDPAIYTITGEAVGQPLSFSNQSFGISSRPRTNASITWQPPTWDHVGEEGAAQQTADLTGIVQELVNQPGYADNGALVFIIEGQGKRVAESFDGKPSKAPRLVVSFVAFCEDDDADGVCNLQDVCPGGPDPGTPCNDNNAATYDDVITENCNCLGTPYDCAQLLANIGDACDDGDPSTINDEVMDNCTCAGVVPGASITVCSQIAASKDDAEERPDGDMSLGSSDLELATDHQLLQNIGMRFGGLDLPQGAVIEEARIQFTVDETNNLDSCLLSVYGELSEEPAPFTNTDFDISSRPVTDAAVNWSPGLWTETGLTGPEQQTPDLSEVVQEIVNQSGYSPGSALVLMISGTGRRVAESYDGDPLGAAQLCVTFVVPSPPAAGLMLGNSSSLADLRFGGSPKKDQITDWRVYPNPAHNDVFISYNSLSETEVRIEIQDVDGRILRKQTQYSTSGKNLLQLSGLNLPNGVYVVRLEAGGLWYTRKLVVVK